MSTPPAPRVDEPDPTVPAASLLRWLASLALVGGVAAGLAALGHWRGGAWLGAVTGAMVAGLLLGCLLRSQRPARRATLAIVALAGMAGGAILAGALPLTAAIHAVAMAAGALVVDAFVRAKRLDPNGLLDPAAFGWTVAAALALLPPMQWLASATVARSMLDGWDLVIAGVLGVLATLPPALAWPPADAPAEPARRERVALAVLAWLPVPMLLWWRPELLVLGLLPLVAAAARIGPRATASLGALTAVAIAWLGASPAGPGPAILQTIALTAAAILPAAIAIAILAARRTQDAQALTRSQDHVRAVTELGPALVATFDSDGRHRFANRSYLQWLGQDAGQVIGRSLAEVFPEAGTIVAPLRRALAGQPQRQQVELPDGRVLDAQFTPRFSAAGPVDGVHVVAQDASWRSAQERTVDGVLAATLDASVVLDASGSIARVNGKAEALLGASAISLRGLPLSAWLDPPAADAVAAALPQVCAQRIARSLPRSLELHARRADGTPFPVEMQLAPLDGLRGVQAVVALQDIGPRLAWEQLMVGTRSDAEATLHAIGAAVVACDMQQHITVFNPAAEQLSGWPAHEALGQPLDDVLRFVDAESGAHVSSLLGEAIRRNATLRKHDDKLLLRRDGERAAVAESAAPMRDQFGLTSGGVVLLNDVSHSQAQAQNLTHQAQHDHLTGLPNRVLLQDRLSQALAQMDRGYKGALLYLDLDHFKPINDRLGHPVGDRVLQEIASRLRAGVREDDTVSRQGGDEFVLLLVRLADPRDAARVAGKLITAIEQPVLVDGHELMVSASIGIALFPQDGSDTATVTKHADAALYHAKEGGRGRYSYFTDIMSASAEERMRTEHDLRIALSNGDFVLQWQPQVHLPKRRIDGVEGLLRWRQPDGSLMLPEAFIQVAEETGLLVQIDEWVLREACLQNRRWQLDAPAIAPVPVSVNVSLARFDAERLLAHVRAVLDETGLAPQWLELEFKGVQLFAQGARGQALVAALKALGVRVAADDFGSGQASLGALAQFAFDTLKIDRSFVHGIAEDAHSRAVTEAVLGIGQAMEYRVVAKGVETDAQYDALVQMGCAGMQGRMFGEPGPAERFSALLARGRAERTAITP